MYKILIADDEGIVTDSLQYIIEKNFGSECQVAIAKNGRQAIEIAESFQPDMALQWAEGHGGNPRPESQGQDSDPDGL